MERQEIVNLNLVALLPKNRWLNIVPIIFLIDFALNSLEFEILLFLDFLKAAIIKMITIIRLAWIAIRLVDTSLFIWIVLEVKKAFEEFHTVLESSEWKE